MSGTHQVVYVAATLQQAQLLRNLLMEHGIFAYVSNDTLNAVHFAGGDLLVRMAGGPGLHDTAPRVIVHEDDAEEAREIVLEAEQTLREGVAAPEIVALEAEVDDELFEWPACPHCGRPRHTSCPVCQTAGTNFAQAFMPEDEDYCVRAPAEQGLMVICDICDEAFSPRFPKRCEWCGHQFADGHELRADRAYVTPPLPEMNARIWIVLLGTVGAIAGATALFYSIATQP